MSYPKASDWIIGVAFAKGVGWTAERTGGNAEEVEAAEARLALAREGIPANTMAVTSPPNNSAKHAFAKARPGYARAISKTVGGSGLPAHGEILPSGHGSFSGIIAPGIGTAANR